MPILAQTQCMIREKGVSFSCVKGAAGWERNW